MENESYNYYNLLVNIAIAIFSFCVIVVAVWGDYIKSCIFKQKLKILDYNLQGERTIAKGGNAYFYHLKVKKINGSGMVKNCRLLLSKVEVFNNGNFNKLEWAVPRPFNIAPAELNITFANFPNEQIFDFGAILQNTPIFYPALQGIPILRNDELRSNSKKRYYIDIEAENYYHKEAAVYEISWDGIWNDDSDIMKGHLKIQRIDKNGNLIDP